MRPLNHTTTGTHKFPTVFTSSFALAAALCAGLACQAVADEYQNPVLPGDFPDPSIARIGGEYWATATSSEWAPIFPLFRSGDLVNWTLEGSVFHQPPEWSEGRYWAPEICSYMGKVYVYYVAGKKGGALSIGVATANKPAGPYTDHGILVADPVGAIDPIAISDDNGDRYLIWKIDGNSRNEPTPIYAQKLTRDGLKLDGPRKELLRNDAPWEGSLIEGPFVIKHGGWWYLFYAGNACCGNRCQYGTGVARSKSPLGPYEKCPANPIIAANDKWKCPGHGSLVETPDGKTFFMYHAYSREGSIYIGRQGVIDEVTWTPDGWPVVNNNKGPSSTAPAPFKPSNAKTGTGFHDDFTGKTLHPRWNWQPGAEPHIKSGKKGLVLSPPARRETNILGAIVGTRTTSGNYEAVTRLDLASLPAGQAAGLFAVGNYYNALGIVVRDGQISLLRRFKRDDKIIASIRNPGSKTLDLRMEAKDGHNFRFSCRINEKDEWREIGGGAGLEGDYLPPWDLGVRVALTSGGAKGGSATFKWIRVTPVKPENLNRNR